MNALAELKRFPETKEQIESFALAVVNEMLSDGGNPIEVAVRLKLLEETIKKIRSNHRVQNAIAEEIENQNDSFLGASLKLKTRRTLDFSGDPIWQQKKGELKAREALLKETGGVDPETGEVVVKEKQTEFIEIKLK